MANSWDFYDKHGEEYTNLQIAHSGGRVEVDRQIMRRIFLEKISVAPKPVSVVEVGCGAGLDLSTWINLGALQVTGVEPSGTMLTAARRKVARLKRVNVFLGEWNLLPVQTSSESFVMARYSLHLADNLERAFSEAGCALKKGGWFIFVVPHPDYHARLVREGKKTAEGMLMSPLFDGRITVPNPPRSSMKQYRNAARLHFDCFECTPFNDTGVAGGDDENPTGMVCACRAGD